MARIDQLKTCLLKEMKRGKEEQIDLRNEKGSRR